MLVMPETCRVNARMQKGWSQQRSCSTISPFNLKAVATKKENKKTNNNKYLLQYE